MTEQGVASPRGDDDAWGRLLLRTDKPLARVEDWLNFASGAVILVLMGLGVTQILIRKLGAGGVFGYIDIVEISMAFFAFLGAAYCQRLGGHIRMDIVLDRLPRRALWGAEMMGSLVALFVIVVLGFFAWEHMERAFVYGDSTIDISLPLWPSKLVIPVAFALLSLRILVQFAAQLRLFLNPTLLPLCTPVIRSVSQAASEEIEAVFRHEDEDEDGEEGRIGEGEKSS